MSGFGQIKNNFAVDDRVVIGQTGPSGLDGRTGVVLGKSMWLISISLALTLHIWVKKPS
jgi:hypothetical protein